MSITRTNWKPLAILKLVVGTILVLVGVMGCLEILKNIWFLSGNPNIGFYIISNQLLWAFGNSALLLIGILYLQQGRILLKSRHRLVDSTNFNTSNKRANFLIAVVMIIALALLSMVYINTKEYVEILSRY